MIKIGLLGATGRVGTLIIQALQEREDLKLSCIYVKDLNNPKITLDSEVVLTNQWEVFLDKSDVIIDFSNPLATFELLKAMTKIHKPLVIGTTGLSERENRLIEEIAKISPIVYASNTSRGIALLEQLVGIVSCALRDADIEISEIHHHHKKDSPSGTALSLAQACAKARELDLAKVRISGRDGNIGERKKDEIGVMSLRGGDIVGRHTVGFYCDGEYLELTHNATNRKTFAIGALEAALWVSSKTKGLYEMKDVLQ